MVSNNGYQAQAAFRSGVLAVVVAGSLGAPQLLLAQPNFSLLLSGTTDSNEGRTLDAEVSAANASWWQLGAGGGSTRSVASTGTLRGTSIRAFADAHSDHLGGRGYYQYWHAAPYALQTTGARTSFTAGNLQFSISGEAKSLDIDYTANPSTGQRDTAHFTGSGWGGSANYRHDKWNLYVSGIWYHYGALSRYVQTQFSSNTPGAPPTPTNPGAPPNPLTPLLPGSESLPPPDLAPPIAPGTPGLTGSLLALNQGVLTRQFAAGVARNFERSTLYVDWSGSKDAVFDKTVNYYSTSYLYWFTGTLRATATVGVSKSDYGSSSYGGLSLGVDF